MNEYTVYPSGEKAAKENKKPEVISFDAYASGQENAQNKETSLSEDMMNLSNITLAVALVAGTGAAYFGKELNEASVNLGNAGFAKYHNNSAHTEQAEVEYGVGCVGAMGGAVIGGTGILTAATASAVMIMKVKRAYENSAAKEKVKPIMRKIGKFMKAAAEKVALNKNDTMHKGKYHHTVVPAKDGKKGHIYVNPLKKAMNVFRDSSR